MARRLVVEVGTAVKYLLLEAGENNTHIIGNELFERKYINEFMELAKDIIRKNAENESWLLIANYDKV